MTNLKNAAYIASLSALSVLSSPVSFVNAQLDFDLNNPGGTANEISNIRIPDLLRTGIQVILASAGLVAFFMLLWGGVQWIMAGGDKEGTEKARKRITSALIGLAIVFSAYALIFIMQALFGINPIDIYIPKVGTQQ